jgi:hypothetical protein
LTSKLVERSGYVLVLTLGLLALSAISLASLARYSLSLAAATSAEAQELQRRWGLISARHFFAEQAASILDSQVPPHEFNTPPWPKPASVTTEFQLGHHTFSVVVADEGAKVNLNTLFERRSDRIAPLIRRLQRGKGEFPVRLLPQESGGRPFCSWGQVFDLAPASGACRPAAELVAATTDITCWGSRRLNVRRATDAALREVAALALPFNEVGKLVESRKNWGGDDVNELLANLDLRRPQLSAASRLLADESQNYSVWIEVESGQQKWSYQYVDDGGPVCFAW